MNGNDSDQGRSNPHHLVMGTLRDVLTGQVKDDTHDERYRQQIARLLLEKGYQPEQIHAGRDLTVRAGGKSGRIRLGFVVNVDGRPAMLIQYAPGSLVTRYRSALAASRLVADRPLAVVVVTNGRQAHRIDPKTARAVEKGWSAIPDVPRLRLLAADVLPPLAENQRQMEQRILLACEIDDGCPCDTDRCLLDEASSTRPS